MPRLTKEIWVALAIIVIVVLITLMTIALLDEGAESKVSVCVTTEQRDHIRAVMLNAVDRALDEQVGKLFANWVLDGTDQPRRAQNGTNNAVKAHIIARANVLAWDPAECTAGFQLQSVASLVRPWR